MKKSISYLPSTNQNDLNFIVEIILKRLKNTEMIFLYGSYARNDYVTYDYINKLGERPFYKSDYDVLVLTSGISEGIAGKALDNIEDHYKRIKIPERHPLVQFINDDIKKFNKDLKEGKYFATHIKQEGVLLYNTGKHKLARRRKLNFEKIKQQAEEYYKEKSLRAYSFLCDAQGAYNRKDYKQASFHLHQATENLFYAIRLVYTLKSSKQHNLSKLLNSVKKYSNDFIKVFPLNTTDEKRLFNLIKSAYVDGRYNPDFLVTREDIDALIPKVELLRDITQHICEKRIKEYEELK
ncbi:MAG: HEPN domain-containing protein [Bacteroidales bacterium]|nr:HEPN domain-containing protein [Bacteroidales bacterium]